MFSTLGDVQYIGGFSKSGGYHEYIVGVQYIGGYHDACGGYHEYIRGCSIHWGGYHEYIGDIMSTSGDFQYIGGIS